MIAEGSANLDALGAPLALGLVDEDAEERPFFPLLLVDLAVFPRRPTEPGSPPAPDPRRWRSVRPPGATSGAPFPGWRCLDILLHRPCSRHTSLGRTGGSPAQCS